MLQRSSPALVLAIITTALTTSLITACGGAEAPAYTSVERAIGTAPNLDARLAIVRSGERILAYVCGGPTTYATHSRWFKGAIDPASDTVTLERAGWTLTIDRIHRIDRSTAIEAIESATLEGPDPQQPRSVFETNALDPGDETSGLYATFDRGCRTGVIATPDGELQGTWCDATGNFKQVERGVSFDAIAGLDVEVQRPDGRAILRVLPALP